MKIYSDKSVYDAAIERIMYLYDEFPNVVIGISGGKDSTVILNLALSVAKELGRLPQKVLFIDQEAEWQGTIDYVESVMSMDGIDPYWYQMPILITNNASTYERYSKCWDAEHEELWVRDKSPLSKKENKCGKMRFHELFEAILRQEFGDKKTCYISGVRAEEAPKRAMSLTSAATYKWITWGSALNKKRGHYTFYPIYDWSYTDVWKYINDNNIPYNKVYDDMYRHGVKVRDMRISNLHHETAIQVLLLVQEIEPKTWEKVSARIPGANTIKHLRKNSFVCPDSYPYMFKDWEEYALYLLDNLVPEEKNKNPIKEHVEKYRKYMVTPKVKSAYYQKVINTILSNDWDLTKLTNFCIDPYFYIVKMVVDGKKDKLNMYESIKNDKYGVLS
jgi:predicted phosphoadenosine phosphosulfate sulfurtransferase